MTLMALFTAFCFVSLFIASVWPTGQLGFAAMASLFVAAAVIEAGHGSGALVYIAGSVLSMLLLPNKTAPLLFVLFFGFYPIVKSLIERLDRKVFQWVLKFVVFSASLTVIRVLLSALFPGFINSPPGIALLFVGGNAVFALFDYGFSKVVCFYSDRVHNHQGRGRARF